MAKSNNKIDRRLTEKQQAILDFIKYYYEKWEVAPTQREMQVAFKFKSSNSVPKYLKILKKKKYLKVRYHALRGIDLIE
ncbi:MAG: LexA family protein [Promethearchaeota archaeon]